MTTRQIPDFVNEAVSRIGAKWDATESEIFGGVRFPNVVRARHEIICELAARPSMPSSGRIADWIGCHHTTVLYALGRLKK